MVTKCITGVVAALPMYHYGERQVIVATSNTEHRYKPPWFGIE